MDGKQDSEKLGKFHEKGAEDGGPTSEPHRQEFDHRVNSEIVLTDPLGNFSEQIGALFG